MKLIKSLGFALNGLTSAWRGQANLRIHFIATLVASSLGFYFKIRPWEWCVIILVCTLVISLELINTAIEHFTDLVTREQSALAGKVKDISAAAVLVAAISSLIIGVIIFGKHLF